MAAYLLVDCEVTDPKRYEDYKRLAPAAIAQYGGRYLVRGGEAVVLEFPDLQRARAFYDSPEYRNARAARSGAAHMNMIAVAGI